MLEPTTSPSDARPASIWLQEIETTLLPVLRSEMKDAVEERDRVMRSWKKHFLVGTPRVLSDSEARTMAESAHRWQEWQGLRGRLAIAVEGRLRAEAALTARKTHGKVIPLWDLGGKLEWSREQTAMKLDLLQRTQDVTRTVEALEALTKVHGREVTSETIESSVRAYKSLSLFWVNDVGEKDQRARFVAGELEAGRELVRALRHLKEAPVCLVQSSNGYRVPSMQAAETFRLLNAIVRRNR